MFNPDPQNALGFCRGRIPFCPPGTSLLPWLQAIRWVLAFAHTRMWYELGTDGPSKTRLRLKQLQGMYVGFSLHLTSLKPMHCSIAMHPCLTAGPAIKW